MKTIQEIKNILESEGFPHIYEWEDAPGTEYPKHSHKGAVSMFILEGGLIMWIDDKKLLLSVGDRFDVPIGVEHFAKVGEQGCKFLVGEMIEGDS